MDETRFIEELEAVGKLLYKISEKYGNIYLSGSKVPGFSFSCITYELEKGKLDDVIYRKIN